MDKITIPTPIRIAYTRGINGTGYLRDSSMRTRLPLHERMMVISAAEQLDMTPSNFIRWCSVQAAAQITGLSLPDSLNK